MCCTAWGFCPHLQVSAAIATRRPCMLQSSASVLCQRLPIACRTTASMQSDINQISESHCAESQDRVYETKLHGFLSAHEVVPVGLLLYSFQGQPCKLLVEAMDHLQDRLYMRQGVQIWLLACQGITACRHKSGTISALSSVAVPQLSCMPRRRQSSDGCSARCTALKKASLDIDDARMQNDPCLPAYNHCLCVEVTSRLVR